MAFGKRSAPLVASATPQRRVLIASGQAIRLDDAAQQEQWRRRYRSSQTWQKQAFYFNKVVGLLGFAHDYTRDSMSRVGLLPAIWPEETAEHPIPLDKDTAPNGLDPDLAKQILSRLEPFPEFMGRTAQQLDIAGECHTALIADDEDVDGETCRVLSMQELFMRGDLWCVRDAMDDSQGQPLVNADGSGFSPEGRQVNAPKRDDLHPPMKVAQGGFFRIWQNDPEFWTQPYSHMVRLLSESDTLLLLTSMLRGIARSRIAMNGRILAIADEFMLPSAGELETEDAGDGEARTNPLIDDFMTAASAAFLDPESAAAAIPLLFVGPRDLIKDGIQSIDLDRPIDAMALNWREELRNDIANGVNLPREILLGLGETNHWNAEEIKNQTWYNHLEPRAMAITSAVTEAFFRPQLLAEGVDPQIVRRCCVWYDPAWFIGNPDLADEADNAYDRYEISGDAYRRVKGFTADDAPDEDEVKYRLWIKQQERVTERVAVVDTGPSALEGTPTGPQDKPLDEGTLDKLKEPSQPTEAKPMPGVPATPAKNTPPAVAPAKAAASLTAASRQTRSRLARLGPRLAGIERDLRTRLLTEANAAEERALEKAGAKVRAAAQRANASLFAQFRAVPPTEVAAVAGSAAVAALGLRDDELLAGAFVGLEARYRTLVARAQRAAAQAAADATGRDVDLDALDEQMADSRDAGWALMAAGLAAILAGALYNPHPDAPAVGEFTEGSLVPVGLIRSALAVAGGAPAPAIPQTVPSPADLVRALGPPAMDAQGGATQGPAMATVYADSLGIEGVTHEWTVGEPSRPFEPHQALDGTTFQDWDDPALKNDDAWPPVDYYLPGDHDGCECGVVTTFTLTGEAAEEAA